MIDEKRYQRVRMGRNVDRYRHLINPDIRTVLTGHNLSPPDDTTRSMGLPVCHTAQAGRAAQRAWRQDLAGGAYDVVWWQGAERDSAAIAERYGGLAVGLADASLVALANRIGTVEIATLDERRFRAVRPVGGGAFRLMPHDST